MKATILILIAALAATVAQAATTINAANRFAYGANIGWIDARGDVANGAVIGEYVCSGYIYGANVGWIHLGGGAPADGIRYGNASAADYGVNHDGIGNLRGFAYGANIGWVNFETNGNPRVNLLTGSLSGFAYSANCGWIGLSNAFAHVQADTIAPGADTDADGITDAWELSFTNTLAAFTAVSDTDGDGVSDLSEHGADTNPLDPGDYLRITFYGVLFAGGVETNMLTWTTRPTRLYQVDYRANLDTGAPWLGATAVLTPDPGTNMTRMISFGASAAERYFQVEALKPLSP